MLHLTADHLQQIKRHAEAAYPEECCGILLGILQPQKEDTLKILVEVIPAENAWNQAIATELQTMQLAASRHSGETARRDRYWIDPADLLQAQRQGRDRGLQIVGIYHSHPDHPPVPSEMDRALAWITYSYVIVSVQRPVQRPVQKSVQLTEATDWGCWCLDANHQFQAEAWQWLAG